MISGSRILFCTKHYPTVKNQETGWAGHTVLSMEVR